MRSLLVLGALFALPAISLPSRVAPPEACFIAAVAVVVDDVKDVKDIKYHRMIVAGIRKLEPSPDASEEACEPRDGTVPMVLRHAAESRLHGGVVKSPQVQVTYILRHSSLKGVGDMIKRYALVARRYSGSFVRVERELVDTPDAPRSLELALPVLAASEAEAAACRADNEVLERNGATYRWAC